MNLIALQAIFIRHERRNENCLIKQPDGSDQYELLPVNYEIPCSFVEAHGVRFLCPKSFLENSGPVGSHQVRVFFEGSPVPPDVGTNKAGKMVRWTKTGSGLIDLSLFPSIEEQDDICKWHGFVTNGDAT